MPNQIGTLNDLFAALFRTAEGAEPVIRQPQRPVREELFSLFFPDELVRQYTDKSKSNLTWFFNSDPRNKSVRRSLIAMIAADPRDVIVKTHRKCCEALWPIPGNGVFDSAALKEVLFSVRIPDAWNSRWKILEGEYGKSSQLEAFCQADPSAALARVLLTLAVGEEIPIETAGEIWRREAEDNCEFIRRDDSPQSEIRYCRMLDLQGRRERAFEGYERIAGQLGRPAQTVDEAAMYCRLAEMRFTGDGCLRDERAALTYDRLACLEEGYPRAFYQLGKHATGSEARSAMEKAAEQGYGPAIRELGTAWYNGSARLACVRNADNARRCFQSGLTLPGEDGAYCAYMLGQIYESQGERAAAVKVYRVAQENGSTDAGEKLARLDWLLEADEGVHVASENVLRYCLMNDLTGCNRVFYESLEGQWNVTVCSRDASEVLPGVRNGGSDPVQALRELAQGVYWGGAPQFPELVIALLSQDRRRNLFQAVALLGELQRLALSLGERAWDLVDQVQLYVLAEREYASMLLDSAFGNMKDLYFRVRLCDPAYDAADRLLASAPLFLPQMHTKDARVRLQLIGCGETAMAVLQRAITLPMPEGTLSIDVYGEGAEAMRRRLDQLCPGLKSTGETLQCPAVRFHECPLEEALLLQLEEPGDDGMGTGNYFVFAEEDDAVNLRLGALLRSAMMKRGGDGDWLPFIAVSVRHPVANRLAESLTAGPDITSLKWYSRCELFPFGSLEMYTSRQLRGEALEMRAEQVHMLFIGLPNTRDARHAAMSSYYRRQSGRETARLTALSLVYRAHSAGIDLSGWRLYGTPEEEARLGPAYTRWLEEPEHLQAALREEHARRCRVLLVQGWTPATVDQVSDGARRGNPGHILYPARMHPFLCPWEALESGELLKQVRRAVRTWFPEKSVPDPRRDEEASVRDTGRLLDGA